MGLRTRLRFYLPIAAHTVLENIFTSQPIIEYHKSTRNQHIQQLYAKGELMSDLSKMFGVSPQRISQIVHGQHH
jgi:hypothetical protein